ncbi:MAG TPA: type III pantothenate kinase, partial [Leptospiraceae bacterium]|nr:type III pantothenate kinase [Leptospiraceae bacterium]
PRKVLGDSTIESLQSGFFYGWVGLLEGIIQEIKREYGQDYKVIGTGGLITTIHNSRKGLLDYIDPLLTLKGLKLLYEMNR